MDRNSIDIAAQEMALQAPEDILAWGLAQFDDRMALASSFGAEDVVLIDMLSRLSGRPRIFALDTGRLHEETYAVMERIRERYGISIEVYYPERAAVEELERGQGFYSFRTSPEARHLCCAIRKVEPLQRALTGLEAWVTGLRREQNVTRTHVPVVQFDAANGGIAKLNPLADWSSDQVWDYIRRHDAPYNQLHDEGFPSIGCAPCTRAVAPGEHPRSGRWWWESPEQKECGLHTGAGTSA